MGDFLKGIGAVIFAIILMGIGIGLALLGLMFSWVIGGIFIVGFIAVGIYVEVMGGGKKHKDRNRRP